ncbi:MAG: hypothetical protein JRI36_12785, partial [Deltaproteobacteria bacterium]|nr:hypothetical protein [Deltaproteobacteria bacterium]
MRKIIWMLQETRKNMLTNPSTERLAEIDSMFGVLDRNLSGFADYGNEELTEVMTSADFTYAIQEFVQRRSLPSYQEQTFAFEPLVHNDTVPNYLNVNRYQNRGGVDNLEYVGEKGPPRAGSVLDATKRQWKVYRWEKQFDFSHEALINDDLGYFDDVAVMMGRAARRTLEEYVSRFYTNATSIARLTGLGALYSTNGRLTTARISSARMAFGQRVDARNKRILTPMNFIVYHSGLKDTVAQIQSSELVPELATNAANVVRGTFTAIEDPYIAGTAPNLPWWAFCPPAQIKTLVLVRRAGQAGPMILRRKSDIESVTSMLGAGAAVDPIMGDFESGNIVLKVTDTF